MSRNPYRRDIVGIFILAPLLVALETFRRWGDLSGYYYFDDVWLAALALMSGVLLLKRRLIGQVLWVFTCGSAFCMIYYSFFSSLHHIDEADPSGLATTKVVVFKGCMYGFVLWFGLRAVRMLLNYRFGTERGR